MLCCNSYCVNIWQVVMLDGHLDGYLNSYCHQPSRQSMFYARAASYIIYGHESETNMKAVYRMYTFKIQ
jgi:hypothetical protein